MGAVIAPRLSAGEAWPSWWDRGARRARTTLSNYAATLGIHGDVNTAFRAAAWGIDASDATIHRLTQTTSATEDEIRASLLVSLRGVCLPDTWAYGAGTTGAVQAWAYPAATGACPRCVAEADIDTDGGCTLPVTAKTPWHFACLRHDGALLHRHCPACGGRIGPGRPDGSTFPSQPHRRYLPGTCRWSSDHGRDNGPSGWAFCGHDLGTDAPVGVITRDSPAWLAQSRLLLALHGVPLATPVGEGVGAFDQLRNLAALTLATIDDDDVAAAEPATAAMLTDRLRARAAAADDRAGRRDGRHGCRVRTWLAPPTNPLTLAWAIPTALGLADLADDAVETAARRLRNTASGRVTMLLDRYSVHPALAERLRRLATARTVAFDTTNLPGDRLFDADRLPLLVDIDDYRTRYQPILGGLALLEDTARTAITIALVRYATGDTWEQCAAPFGIGLDDYGQIGVVRNVLNKLQAADRSRQFEVAIAEHASDIAAAPDGPDWWIRRREAATWTPDPASVDAVYAAAGIRTSPSRRIHLVAWMWEQHTGNPWRQAPIWGPTGASESDREVARRWRRTLLPRLDLTVTDSQPLFGSDRLARLYDDGDYDTWFAPLFDDLAIERDTAREFVSITLLHHAHRAVRTWSDLAADLGIPVGARNRVVTVEYASALLSRADRHARYDQAITAAADHIASAPAIVDWDDRRRRFRTWTLDSRTAEGIYTAAGVTPNPSRVLNLAASAWADVTGNPWQEAPAWPAGSASHNERTVAAKWRRNVRPAIDAHTEALLDAIALDPAAFGADTPAPAERRRRPPAH